MAVSQMTEFVSRKMRGPLIWGQSDCFCVVADWVYERTGFDPGARWRGQYSTQDEARRILRREGGLVGLMSAVMSSFCGVSQGQLEAGDVCVAMTDAVYAGHRTKAHVCAISVDGNMCVFKYRDNAATYLSAPLLEPVVSWRLT